LNPAASGIFYFYFRILVTKKISLRKLPAKKFISISVLLCLMIWFVFCLPSRLFPKPASYILEDKDGNLLSASIAEDGQWHFPYDANVPDKFSKCITGFEDKRFYYHPALTRLLCAVH